MKLIAIVACLVLTIFQLHCFEIMARPEESERADQHSPGIPYNHGISTGKESDVHIARAGGEEPKHSVDEQSEAPHPIDSEVSGQNSSSWKSIPEVVYFLRFRDSLWATRYATITDSEGAALPAPDQTRRVPELLAPLSARSTTFRLRKYPPYLVGSKETVRIEVDPTKLNLPQECGHEQVLIDLWLLNDPLEAVASGVPMSIGSRQSEEQVLLESLGMFRLDIRCGETPLSLKEGKSLSLDVPTVILESGAGLHRFGSEGWKQRGRPPIESGTLFRIPMVADEGRQMRDPRGVVVMNPMDRDFHTLTYNGDAMELFVPHGERYAVKLAIAQHEPKILVLAGDSSRPVLRPPPVSFRAISSPGEHLSYRLLRRYPLKQSPFWPDRKPPENCMLSVIVIPYWQFGSIIGTALVSLEDERGVESGFGKIPVYSDAFSRGCYSAKQLEQVPQPLKFRRQFRVQSGASLKMDPLEPVTEPTEVVLLHTLLNRPSENQLAALEDDLGSRWRAYAAIDRLGLWNLNRPRRDLACLTGSVRSTEPYMVSIIATEKFIHNSSWFATDNFRKVFPRNEPFRILVVSGDRAGTSKPVTLSEGIGEGACLDVGEIELQLIPKEDRATPSALRRALGF